MSMSDFSEQPKSLSLIDLMLAALRHWILIPLLFLLGLAAGLAILKVSKPSYQTDAQVLLVQPDQAFSANANQAADPQLVIDERYVEGQVSVVGSADFAAKISKKLDLASKLGTIEPAGTLKKFLINWGFANDKAKLTAEQRAVASVQEQVKVFSIPNSSVIDVRVTGPDPQLAADLANGIADLYIDSISGKDNPNQKRIQDWLSNQITELRKKVAESEGAAERFRSTAGLLKGTSSTLGTEQISAINSQLTEAEAAEAEAVTKVSAIKALLAQRGSVASASDVMNSAVVQQLQQQRISANRAVSELSATYLSNHPKLIAAKQQVSEIDRQIRSEAIKIVEGLESQAQLAGAKTKSLRKALDGLKQSESSANLEDVQLKALERESTANRQLLETLLARYVEINTRQDLEVRPTTARVIERALVPAFITFPKPGPIVLLSSLAGLVLGLGLAFLMEIAKATTRPIGRRDFARETGYVSPPRENAQRHMSRADVNSQRDPIRPEPEFRRETGFTGSVAAVQQETVPDLVQKSAAASIVGEPVHVPATSTVLGPDTSLAGELLRFKKTDVAANIAFVRVGCAPRDSAMAVVAAARGLAASNNRVLVIDMDMERAELEQLFKVPEGPGLLDLLAGQSDFNRLICRDEQSSVQVIRLGDPANAPKMDVLSARLQSILKSLQGIYDFIIIHSGKAAAESLPIVTLGDVAAMISPPSHDQETVKAMQMLREKSPMEIVHVSVEPA
jgi:succinoglycan biosynthesis transport protein ExoP